MKWDKWMYRLNEMKQMDERLNEMGRMDVKIK
jgi:hypothetical protein